MTIERAYKNLKAMQHRPAAVVQAEIATLVIAGLETLNAIEQLQSVLDDIELRVGDLEAGLRRLGDYCER